MALTDYAQKRAERIFARLQPTVGAFAMPTERDAIKLRGPATLPLTASDFAQSEEIRDTPDVDQLLKRKKPPAEFSLVVYAKVPTTPGVLPQWDALMRQSYGSGELVVTMGPGSIGGATITVVVDGVATPVTIAASGGDPAARATAVAAALDAVAGVSARADGANVYVHGEDGAGQVTIATTAAPDVAAIGPVRYTLVTRPVDITERLLSMIHYTDNAADYYRDCLVNAVTVRAEGTSEASITFGGMLGNSTSVFQTTLGPGGLAAHGGTAAILFYVRDLAIQVGPTDLDVAYCAIDGEAFKITAFDPVPTVGGPNDGCYQVTAIGGQFGTTPATHAGDAEVLPYIPGPDPDANDHIIGLTLGQFAVEGKAYRVINVESLKDERIVPRIDEAFEAALTGYKRTLDPRTVGGTVQAYQRRAMLELANWSELEREGPATLRLGPATGPRIEIDWPHFRLRRVEKGENAGEFTRSFPFDGLASGTPGNDGITLTVFAA
jgi:hypothetical protein